jgi:hypothetical protein
MSCNTTDMLFFKCSIIVNEEAVVEWVSGHQVHVKFAPTLESQRRLGAAAGSEDKGLGGQFIVRYDVQRDNSAGEVLVSILCSFLNFNSLSVIYELCYLVVDGIIFSF